MSDLTPQLFHLESKHGKHHADAVGYEFNGSDDFIALPSTWGGQDWTEMTVDAWVNPSEATGDFQAILSPATTSFIHFQLNTAGNGNIAIYTDRGPIGLPVIPLQPLNQWRHVVVIAKSGASRLLIDGEQVGDTNTQEFNYVTSTDELYVGKGHNGGRMFKGKIGGLSITHHAKAHEDIHDDIFKHMVERPNLEVPAPAPKPSSGLYGFKSHHGKYMSAQPDGRIECNRDALLGWEQFTLIDTDDGKVALKSHHGKYLSAQPDGRLEVNRGALNAWEKFTVEEKDGKVGFKSVHGKYVSAQPDGRIECNRNALLGWELFTKEAVKQAV